MFGFAIWRSPALVPPQPNPRVSLRNVATGNFVTRIKCGGIKNDPKELLGGFGKKSMREVDLFVSKVDQGSLARGSRFIINSSKGKEQSSGVEIIVKQDQHKDLVLTIKRNLADEKKVFAMGPYKVIKVSPKAHKVIVAYLTGLKETLEERELSTLFDHEDFKTDLLKEVDLMLPIVADTRYMQFHQFVAFTALIVKVKLVEDFFFKEKNATVDTIYNWVIANWTHHEGQRLRIDGTVYTVKEVGWVTLTIEDEDYDWISTVYYSELNKKTVQILPPTMPFLKIIDFKPITKEVQQEFEREIVKKMSDNEFISETPFPPYCCRQYPSLTDPNITMRIECNIIYERKDKFMEAESALAEMILDEVARLGIQFVVDGK